MQAAMKAGWVGRTYALPMCSSSPGKKKRNRRSKEERKTMVESFVTKYQESNNGSFPSLNLTHKEVGGSFYTIREIVREIIQENKVLGPGNPNSQGVSLDDWVEPSSIEVGSHFSLATNGHLIKEVQKEEIFVSSHLQLQGEDVVVAEGDPDSNICIKSYDCKNSQVVDCDILDVNKDVLKKPQKVQYKPQGDNQVNLTDQSNDEGDSKIHELENPVRDSQGNFGSSVSATMLQSKENIGNTVLDNIGDAISKSTEVDSSEDLASAYGDILSVSDDMGNTNKVPSSQHPMKEEISITGNIFPGISDDKFAKRCTTGLGTSDSPTSETTKIKVEPLASNTRTEKANITSETVPDLSPCHETAKIEVRNDIRHSFTGNKLGSSSLSDEVSSELSEDASEHQVLQGTNHVLSAIKDFVTAIIKFFRE